jgi:MYXO-CTERM domain-containing protein
MTYEVAYQSPGTPQVTQPANGATGVDTRPRIEGTAEPGVMVQLYMDGVPYASVVAFSTGAFSYNSGTDLVGGVHEVEAAAEVFGAYSARSGINRFEVGTAGDGGVVDGGLTGTQPILVVPAESAVVDPLPLFAGTSLSGASVSILVDGTELARVNLDEEGRFRYTPAAEQKLASGAHSALVQAWETDGGVGLSSSTTHFEVKPAEALDVGCGCGTSPGAGLGITALLLGLGAARLRRKE